MGRGGSDTTAVSIAAALNADKCYIYSDVEGVFTTDPKKVSNAQKLKEVSYDEMLDISNEGAKVLHNRCIEISQKFNIPIIAKSTFTDDDGTIINNKIEAQKIKSIVKNDKLMKITISNDTKENINIYNKLIQNNVIPLEYTLIENEIILLINSSQLNKITDIIKQNFKKCKITICNISRISIIGYGILSDSLILEKIINILNNENVEISTIDLNNNKIRITFKNIISNSLLEIFHKNLVELEN